MIAKIFDMMIEYAPYFWKGTKVTLLLSLNAVVPGAALAAAMAEELARRKATGAALEQLKSQLPDAQLENAQASLRQGDKDAAKSVFHGVLDKEGASVALAA